MSKQLNQNNPSVTTALRILEVIGISESDSNYESFVIGTALIIRDEYMVKELDKIRNNIANTVTIQYPITY